MALLWAESFDLYGTSSSILLQRGYLLIGTLTFSSSNTRTGTYSVTPSTRLTLPINSPRMIGFGVAVMPTSIGTGGHTNQGVGYNTGTTGFMQIVLNENLGYSVYIGTTLMGETDPNVFVLNSFHYLECKITCNNGGTNTGTVELRINGTQVLVINGLNLVDDIESINLGSAYSNNTDAYYDDLVVWDDTGTRNNDFLGDRRCVTSMVDADTVEADWTLSSGTEGFALIDEIPPDDAGYIEAAVVGDISEFEKAPIGIDTNDIAGIAVIARALKTDAGVSTFSAGVHSGAFVSNSGDFSPNTTPAYFSHIIETDPNGDIPWTQASVDAANIRVTRTS